MDSSTSYTILLAFRRDLTTGIAGLVEPVRNVAVFSDETNQAVPKNPK